MAASADGDNIGTWLRTGRQPQTARKQWLAGLLQVQGHIELDAGAVKVLRESGRSLLPVGVVNVKGNFSRGDLVSLTDSKGNEVARGLVNYPADEARRIAGRASGDIEPLLGYGGDPEMIHRDNLVLA